MNSNQNNDDIEKTFIEGSDVEKPAGQTGLHSLKAGTKINVNSEQITAAYSQTQIGANAILPEEEDGVPLGSGKIVGVLGTGGMAKVYKIWNEKLEVFRAAKILLPNQQGDLMNRFETEAKITAKLHHPNIVEIYNVGEWNNLPFLEMELIDGDSLEQLINKEGKIPETVCSAIAIFIARALTYAHGQEFLLYGKNYNGVIHRDLKPANIMIDKNGTVKLMDFGIARPTETSFHTVEGGIVGTLQYLAPEQIDGEGIDHGADVYALGAILYEMLTGTKTFPQKTITNLMQKKATNEYRKFDDFEFRVNTQLCKIAQKCLSVSKKDRYESAKALLQALEAAHKTLTSETPEEIIIHYLKDPDSLKTSAKVNFFRFVKPKILIPVGLATVLTALVIVFIQTGPKLAKKMPESEVNQNTKALSAQQAAAKTPEAPFDQELKPLAPQNKLSEKGPSEKEKNVTKSPPPKSQSVKPIPRRRRRPVQKKLSPREELKKKYDSDDLFTIAKRALGKNNSSDAILALENMPGDSKEKSIFLLEAYVQAGKTKDALYIVNSRKINDGQYEFLAGKTYYMINNNAQALNHFDDALLKPCATRNRNGVRNDALYYTALIRSRLYSARPSSDNRGHALQAWLVVKNCYRNNTSHIRYKKAVEQLASIK
ncbi:MAG: protein kinase [Chitinivibrionales bacterium]|nr:protein kinase [Chitinivibrionales bacterium]